MRVRELIDILSDQPPDAEVELAHVKPIDADDEDITVDRFSIDGVLPWDEEHGMLADEGTDPVVVWLVGGEEDDVDAFLDAVEPEDDSDDADDADHGDHDH